MEVVLRSRPISTHYSSVSQDWRMPLKGDKSHLYINYIKRLETAYSMFSVNLDEAFGMRRTGRASKASQVLSVAPALCNRLSIPMNCLLRAMLDHSKHFGVAPNLAPLDPQNFQHSRSQRVALFNDLFSRILLTRKSQFAHKISAIADLVEELDTTFASTAEELASGESFRPDQDWDLLDSIHYDLNTCLRETVVLLKSFLHALPDQQLYGFQDVLHSSPDSPSLPLVHRPRHLAHRRIAFLKGQ
jgi:hypothetical protein